MLVIGFQAAWAICGPVSATSANTKFYSVTANFSKQVFNFTPTLVSTSVHSDSVPSGWAGAIVDDLRFRLLKKGKHDATIIFASKKNGKH